MTVFLKYGLTAHRYFSHVDVWVSYHMSPTSSVIERRFSSACLADRLYLPVHQFDKNLSLVFSFDLGLYNNTLLTRDMTLD